MELNKISQLNFAGSSVNIKVEFEQPMGYFCFIYLFTNLQVEEIKHKRNKQKHILKC